MKRSSETDEEHVKRLQNDLSHFQSRAEDFLLKTPSAFVYPYGAYNQEIETLVRELGFQATFSCREGMNYITHNPECLFQLKRYLRSPQRSISEML